MVLFFYVGGGAQGLGFSLAIFVASILFNSGGLTPLLGGGRSGSWSQSYSQHSSFDSTRGAGSDYFSRQNMGMHGLQSHRTIVYVLVFIVAAIVVCSSVLRHPAVAQHWAVVRMHEVILRWRNWLDRRMIEIVGRFEGTPQRERASQGIVNTLPTECFVPESEIRNWGISALRAELQRLHARARGPRGGFAGGSESAATHSLLEKGGVVEKSELVRAVVVARGGESGRSCSICLEDYESGATLRVLPCGHRFHTHCVDPWLIEQSRTCPLCSKSV